jgi:DNA invertase Pin-like site-specific DNA recombinase
MNNRSVILARVSSKSQEAEGYSLDSQERMLEEYNNRQAYKVDKIFKIAETASKETQRQIFHDMMKYVRSQKIHIITVEKVDRFVRNFKDVVLTDEWLEEDEYNQVHFVKDGIVLHKNAKSTEKLNWGIRVVIAKNFIDNLKEEVKKAQKEKLAQGWYPSSPPPGYISFGEKGKKIHIVDKAKAALVKRVFEQALEPNENFETLTAFASSIGLKSSNGRPLGRSHLVNTILRNKFYIGINTWNGVEYPGAHETFISDKLFYDVQDKIKRKEAPQYHRHYPDLKDIFYCSICGGRATWEFHRTHWYGHCNYKYYNCEPLGMIRQDSVETQLIPYLNAVLFPDREVAKWIISELKTELKKGQFDNFKLIRQMTEEQDRTKRQLNLLYQDRLSERITTKQYDEMRKDIEQKVADIGKRIANVDNSSSEAIARGIEVLETTLIAYKDLKTMTPAEKKKLLLDIFQTCGIKGKSIEMEYSKEAQIIVEMVKLDKNQEIYFRRSKKSPINRDKKSNFNIEKRYRAIIHPVRFPNP